MSRVLGRPRLRGPTGPLGRGGLRHLGDGLAGPPVPEEGEGGAGLAVEHQVLWRRRHADVTSCEGGGPGEVQAAGGAVMGGGLGGGPLSWSVLIPLRRAV